MVPHLTPPVEVQKPIVLKIGRVESYRLTEEDCQAMREHGIFIKANGILKTLRRLHPGVVIQPEQVQKMLWEAYRATDEALGEADAIKWADNFSFPEGMAARDAAGLAAAESLEAYVRHRQQEMRAEHGRIDATRVRSVLSEDHPDFSRVLALVEGIPIFTSSEFKPNGAPPPLRAKYRRMHSVINKLVYDLYERGLVIVLPTEQAVKIEGIHFSMAHWTTQATKIKGRFLGDVAAAESGTPLNADEVKLEFDAVMGQIEHPTLHDICDRIALAAERWGWEEILIAKMDLRGAFTLLFIRPEDVRLLAFELTGGFTMLHICGFFGYTGLPACFAVISRILAHVIGLIIMGLILIYVDDLMIFTTRTALERDMRQARDTCTSLLGNDAVEDAKSAFGRRMDLIGWSVDLDQRNVSVSLKNFQKALAAFVRVAVERVTVGELLTLASYASRYSTVVRSMKPFTADLFVALGNWKNKKVVLTLSEDAKRAIKVWRVSLVLLELDRAAFARPILSIIRRPVSWLLEFDASLTGIGLIISSIGDSDDAQPLVRWASSTTLPFEFDSQSAFQNTAEFTAVVLGMAVIAHFGGRHAGIRLRGDSRSSLQWSATQRFRPGPSRRAAIAFVALGTRFDLSVEETAFIPGVTNIQCDKMSRGFEPTHIDVGFSEDQALRIQGIGELWGLLMSLDPTHPIETDAEFETMWGGVDRAIRALA